MTLEIITKIIDADKATHNVSIGYVLAQLKAGLREKVKNHMCSYFSAKMGCYVYLGVYQPEAQQENADGKVSQCAPLIDRE